MNLYDAIFMRKIVKSYRTETIDDKIQKQILNFTKYITASSEERKISYEILPCSGKQGHPSSHFAVKAPYYFLVTTDKTEEDIISLGLVMEQVALYLLTKELGSCFVGFKKASEKDKLTAVLAFGFTNTDIFNVGKLKRRLSLDSFCVFKDNENQDTRKILSAAILAPSRQNSQPWRFVVTKNRIHVFCKKDIFNLKGQTLDYYKEFDMGMMLAHLMIASEEMWYNAEVVKNEIIAEKTLKNNIYMFTVVLTEQQ